MRDPDPNCEICHGDRNFHLKEDMCECRVDRLDKTKLTSEKHNCDFEMPCFGCGQLTRQRVKTQGMPTIAELLGEEEPESDPSTFWAPICDECLK